MSLFSEGDNWGSWRVWKVIIFSVFILLNETWRNMMFMSSKSNVLMSSSPYYIAVVLRWHSCMCGRGVAFKRALRGRGKGFDGALRRSCFSNLATSYRITNPTYTIIIYYIIYYILYYNILLYILLLFFCTIHFIELHSNDCLFKLTYLKCDRQCW